MRHIRGEFSAFEPWFLDELVECVRKAGGRLTWAELAAEFPGHEAEVHFALGSLWADRRLMLQGTVRDWTQTVVVLGEAEGGTP